GPSDEALLVSLRQRLTDSTPDQPRIMAEIYAISTGLAPKALLPAMRNLYTTLQDSITQMVAAVPATHRHWLPPAIIAGLLPLDAPNAERHHVEDEADLLLVDPRLMWLFEAMSMALMSQTVIGTGVRQGRKTAARFVHDMFLLFTTERLCPPT